MTIFINPGSGPVEDATFEHAILNMDAFTRDVEERRGGQWDFVYTAKDADGRYSFELRHGYESHEIEMPGIPLDQVRWVDGPDQDIWDFPRLYVDGDSWVWKFAVDACDEAES